MAYQRASGRHRPAGRHDLNCPKTPLTALRTPYHEHCRKHPKHRYEGRNIGVLKADDKGKKGKGKGEKGATEGTAFTARESSKCFVRVEGYVRVFAQ